MNEANISRPQCMENVFGRLTFLGVVAGDEKTQSRKIYFVSHHVLVFAELGRMAFHRHRTRCNGICPPSICFLKTSEISEIYVSATSPDRTDAALQGKRRDNGNVHRNGECCSISPNRSRRLLGILTAICMEVAKPPILELSMLSPNFC